MTGTIVIKQDREKPIRNQHPWIFSGAIDEVRGNPTPGEIVTVLSHKGDVSGARLLESRNRRFRCGF